MSIGTSRLKIHGGDTFREEADSACHGGDRRHSLSQDAWGTHSAPIHYMYSACGYVLLIFSFACGAALKQLDYVKAKQRSKPTKKNQEGNGGLPPVGCRL